MKEAKFQTEFGRWLSTGPDFMKGKSGYYELKLCKTKRWNVKQWFTKQGVQGQALFECKHKGVYWKISDTDPRKKPADCVFISKGTPYLVLMYYPSRNVYFLDIDKLIEFWENDGISITQEMAGEMAEYTIESFK